MSFESFHYLHKIFTSFNNNYGPKSVQKLLLYFSSSSNTIQVKRDRKVQRNCTRELHSRKRLTVPQVVTYIVGYFLRRTLYARKDLYVSIELNLRRSPYSYTFAVFGALSREVRGSICNDREYNSSSSSSRDESSK